MEFAAVQIQSSLPLILGSLVIMVVLRLIFPSPVQNKEPPGPRPLPVLGNLLLLNCGQPHHTFLKLSQRFGSVFTFHLGPKKVVVLVGYRTVKEALVDYADEFAERDPFRTFKEEEQDYGVVFSNGKTWREMRRFVLTNLRDFGMGRRHTEDRILEECGPLLRRIGSFGGAAFDTSGIIPAAVFNIVSFLIFGYRFEYDDPEFKEHLYNVQRGIHLLSTKSVQLYEIFPHIGKWFSKERAEISSLKAAKEKFYLKLIGQLKETLDPARKRGIVDAFLTKQQQLEEAGIKDSEFHIRNLIMIVANLNVAGTESTANTLRWSLLYMAKYPHIQDQVREEIVRVIRARQVQIQDRKDLPFTDAVIHESQRMANVAPLSVPHRTSRDVTFQGHFIKKGTTVYPVLTSVLFDESEWEKPHSFYPAHFLDQDGKFRKRDAFMPFSAGHRVCVGEGLARMELFIFFVTLMQRFRFTAPPGVTEEELDIDAWGGFARSPRPHKLCAISLL